MCFWDIKQQPATNKEKSLKKRGTQWIWKAGWKPVLKMKTTKSSTRRHNDTQKYKKIITMIMILIMTINITTTKES